MVLQRLCKFKNKNEYQNCCPIMKWNWLLSFLVGLSNPYPQSTPSRPIIGRNTLTPTPAERLIWKGLNFLISGQQLPPSRNSRAKMVDCGCRITG